MSRTPIVYLSEADVASLSLETSDVMVTLEHAFRLNAVGKILGVPKRSIWIGPGEGFQSLSVLDTENDVAALKWVGLVPPGRTAGPNVNASIILSDTRTGGVCCFMDGQRATALRTAAMSAIGGKYLARTDSRSIGFIGSGVQALSHLRAFSDMLPSINTVRVHSDKISGAEHFATHGQTMGLAAHVATAEEVVAESDIIVSTVPLSPNFQPFLDARKTRPGAFIASIDLGRPWIDSALDHLDVTAVDDEAMRYAAKPGDFIPSLADADATLTDLVAGLHPGRTNADQRTILISSGSAIADLAIGRLIYRRACETGLGQRLTP